MGAAVTSEGRCWVFTTRSSDLTEESLFINRLSCCRFEFPGSIPVRVLKFAMESKLRSVDCLRLTRKENFVAVIFRIFTVAGFDTLYIGKNQPLYLAHLSNK
ncbi:hypothetical protein TNIN_113101 [Trichonephila inaurata madagascariensis]|uniref:Uncharacterized protein n=1 Tax=Trichonephila inaurata madagascariensis TaxID=2747483 RepID=A0A8X6MIX4_9ARAC|nr:hypothetical protein TNIN_113101 [Trichonephila inaurata madagascariensis]